MTCTCQWVAAAWPVDRVATPADERDGLVRRGVARPPGYDTRVTPMFSLKSVEDRGKGYGVVFGVDVPADATFTPEGLLP
ncbi:MAG: hypothetical protein ACRDYU_03830 [Actinomycetes bacterium]